MMNRNVARAGVVLAMLGAAGAARATAWRMVVARDDAVVMIDADTLRRADRQISFAAAIYWQKPDEDDAIGNSGTLTFDCARSLVKSPGLRDIHADGTTNLTRDQKMELTKILPHSLGALIRERMCDGKWDGSVPNGIAMDLPPALAAKSAFGLLAAGLDSERASALAAVKYPDEELLTAQLDDLAVLEEKRDAVRKVLAEQTRRTPPPPPIVPLASAVASGLVGNYTHSEHELAAGIQLRADGTFRYGLTVGSLDETAAGRWTAGGGHVRLVNDPLPVAPTITAGPVTTAVGTPFSIRVVTPRGRDVQGVDFTIMFDTGEPLQDYTTGETWQLPAGETRRPRFITLGMPSYGLRSERLAIDGGAGRIATFILMPNDIGVVDMTGLTVDADRQGLTLHRKEGAMRFERAGE